MTVPPLLDVNVLLALSNPYHVHHRTSRDWWEGWKHSGWASCPLTQNGFIRITCQPGYSLPQTFEVAKRLLSEMIRDPRHRFWSDDISIADDTVFDHTRLKGHRQMTDAYLLALATKNGGRLVTFDASIDFRCVRAAKPENLVVLA